jgi:hypothetical protein
MTPEQVANLMRLADTFKAELAQLGTDVKAINAKLDALAKSVDAINKRLDKMVMFNGDFFTGFRSDLARNAFIDYGGAVRSKAANPFSHVDSPIDFHLIAKANLPGGVKFIGDIVESNYLNYGSLGLAAPAGAGLGGSAHANGGPMETNLYQAELLIPISQFGKDTTLELGRYKNQLTPLTYMRPDTDPYFNLPWYNDGNYIEDGFKLSTKFGSATTEFFAGSYSNLSSSSGSGPLNGVSIGSFTSAGVPDSAFATQSVGLHVGIPLMKYGEAGFTVLDFTNSTTLNEVVYGFNLSLNPIGRFKVSGEISKSVTQGEFSVGDHNSNDDDNAYNLHVDWKSKGLGILAGYQYIDPRFAAPGYWDKIGPLFNPVNVQGPYLKLNYKFTPKLDGDIGGEYYMGARNRDFGAGGFGTGLFGDTDTFLTKGELGLKYKLNKTVHLSADYEGDFFNKGTLAPGGPSDGWAQFITLGAGINLTGNTVLKFGYQVLAYEDKTGSTVFAAGGGTDNANVFTTSVSVHF